MDRNHQRGKNKINGAIIWMKLNIFYCPYCGENISILIDLNFNNQFYTEDCEVCCRPIEINFTVVDGAIESWEASRND